MCRIPIEAALSLESRGGRREPPRGPRCIGCVKRIGTAALAVAFAAGCGGATSAVDAMPSTVATRAPAVERVIVESEDATKVIDPANGGTVASLPGGVASPALDLVVHLTAAAHKTAVAAIDLTGKTGLAVALDGEYAFPNAYGAAPSGFSPNGKWLVLVSRDANESRFAVIDVERQVLASTATLSSRFTFDAIHNDGSAMYLIEHPVPGGTTYNVRLYDLRAAVLRPEIIFDKSQIAQFDPTRGLMDGTFHVSVAPKKGEWSYGLYMRPTGTPFVHALNVPGRYAQCIVDLAGKWSATSMFSMAMTDDGRALYVVDTAGGTVSVIDGLTQKVARRGTFSTRDAVGDPHAAVAVIARDGSRLFASGAHGIAMLQTGDLSLRGWLVPDLAVRSLAISSDGARLYALAGDAVVAIDIASGRVLAELATVRGARAVRLVPADALSRR